LLIVALVAIAGIFALSMLGGNINEMFTKSVDKQASFDPFNVKGEVASSETETVTVVSSEVIDGYPVDKNSDGSITLTVGSQAVNITAELLDLNDTVFETTGSSGDTLISTIAYMIEQNEAEYPDGVPIEISFGEGIRYDNTFPPVSYEGNATANTVAVTAGDNVVLYQKDQTCSGDCSFIGVYRIEGTIGAGNSFNTNNVSVNG